MTAEPTGRVRMVAVLTLITALFVRANLDAAAYAAPPDSIRVRNDGRDRVELWVFPEEIPKVRETTDQDQERRLGNPSKYPGRYGFIIRDSHNREFDCGFFDLHRELHEARAVATIGGRPEGHRVFMVPTEKWMTLSRNGSDLKSISKSRRGRPRPRDRIRGRTKTGTPWRSRSCIANLARRNLRSRSAAHGT